MSDLYESLQDSNSIAQGPPSINQAIDSFQMQNMSPSDIFKMGSSIPSTVGGIPGIGSRIPGLGNVPIPGMGAINQALGTINQFRFGASGTWESVAYSDDLNAHHPKFKFLFKVGFYGFPGGTDYYYYVHRVDKPKVRFQHQDVNYYNFRTRVLTSVTYDPLTIQFLDEIGNSLNTFFVSYLAERSGTGIGNYGIDKGWGEASSSYPYANAYSENHDQKIIVEQIFANGTMSNRFIFRNPRIETFDFDELVHDESTAGSMASITFSYDAIECMTVYGTTIYSWGNLDLLRGGGTSGYPNAGSTAGVNGGFQTSAGGNGIPGQAPKSGMDSIYDMMKKGSDIIGHVPSALSGILSPTPAGMGTQLPGTGGIVPSSNGTILSSQVQGTLSAIKSGSNALNAGSTIPFIGG